MHEASLMASMMRRIDDVAAADRAKRVVGVSVWLGALSHMSAAHFAEHFAQAAAGTIAEDARLDIRVSEDTGDPNAQEILLKSVEIET
jgi:hydrogenase nickel incorporation protein HypA/HybF